MRGKNNIGKTSRREKSSPERGTGRKGSKSGAPAEIGRYHTYVNTHNLISLLSGLWGLVNNAGVCYFAELEMTSDKLFKKVLDINLFGAVRITKSLLPLIRKAKGRIVNVSSLLGKSISNIIF